MFHPQNSIQPLQLKFEAVVVLKATELIHQNCVCSVYVMFTYLELLPQEATDNQHHLCSEFLSQLVSWLSIYHPG